MLHKIQEHILNYQKKYSDIVDDEFCEAQALIELSNWCIKNNKKNNKWHKDLMIKQLNEKRNAEVRK